MNNEQKRVLAIAKDTFESALIKTTDMLLVIASNKDGIWFINGNLKPDQILQMLENVTKEFKSNLENSKKQ